MHLPNTPTPAPTSPVSPQTLLSTLDSSFGFSLDDLCHELHCTPEQLETTLDDPEIETLLRIKAKLATLQVKLIAIQHMPRAAEKLVQLAQTSEKPEVARRSSTTLLNIGGIPTTAQHPPKAPEPPAKVEFSQPPKDCPWDIAMKYATKMVTLRNSEGMDIHNIPDHLYPAFTKALYDFFTSHRLPFVGSVENPYPYIDAKAREQAAAKSQTPTPQTKPETPPTS